MVLPVYQTSPAPPVPHIDLALARDFLFTAVPSPNSRDVYIVFTSAPIRDLQHRMAAADFRVIKLPFVAPLYVENWLSSLRTNLEGGNISSPHDALLYLRSMFYDAGSLGGLIGVEPASARETETACD